jgi:hypothetical protein
MKFVTHKSAFLLIIFLMAGLLGFAQRKIVQAEYFIDTDPGQGNGFPVLAQDGNLDNAIESLFQNGINAGSVGLHTFNIRVKDDSNVWGPVFKTVFYTSTPLVVRNIHVNQAEIFFDNDPGQGQGIPLIAFDGNFNDAIETVSGNVNTFPPNGLHVLNIRVKDNANNWGPPFKTIVNITDPLVIRNIHVSLGEIFFDTDPGQGQGIPLIAFDGNFNDAIETVAGNITSLPPTGLHILNIRVRDNMNNWGPSFKTIVNITDPLVLRNIRISQGEFFFDADPGQGQGVTMLAFDGNFNDAIESINQSWAYLPDTGMHILNVRVRDAANNWGPVFKTILRVLPCVTQSSVTITPNTTQLICPGDQITFTAQSGFTSYTWFRGSTIVGTGQNYVADSAGFYRVYAVDSSGCGVFSSFTQVGLNLYNANITASGPTTFCQGGSVVLTAGSGNTSYSWNTGATSQSITVASSGTFIVTVFNGNCFGTDTVTVTVHPNPPVPVISASPSTAICPGDSVVLTASPANSHAWNTNQYTSSITVNSAGTYSVTVTDANGCQSTGSINVTVFPNPITNISNSVTICQGDTAQLSLTGGVSYQWTPATGLSSTTVANPLASPPTSTQYTVYVVGLGGCSDSATVNVIVNPVPTVSASANNTQICEGNPINLFASPSGASSYIWSGPASFSSTIQNPVISNVTIANSGLYTVSAYNSAGCFDTDTITITVNPGPTAFASSNSLNLCEGDTLSLSSLPNGLSSYNWIGPNGFSSSDQNTSINGVTGTNQGVYTVTVSNGVCSSSASLTINVHSIPTVTATANNVNLCEGSLLSLFASSGANSYVWNGPNLFNSSLQNPQINNVTTLNSGVYTVTAYNSLGCSATDQISITVVPGINAVISGNSPVCEGEAILLNGLPNGMQTYNWSGPNGFNSNTQNASINAAQLTHAGTYTLTVNNGTCNSITTYQVVVKPAPDVTVNQFGAVLNAVQDSANYQWLSCTNAFAPVVGATSQTFTAIENGSYAVVVVYNGCADTSLCFNVTGLGIEDEQNESTWSIYPNPNRGNFSIQAKAGLHFELMDYTGRIINTYHLQNTSTNISENLASGIYFVREKDSGNVQKLIIE